MFEVTYREPTIVFGQKVMVNKTMTTPKVYTVGMVYPDGKEIIAIKTLAKVRAKEVEKYKKPSVAYLRKPLDDAWGRSKWKGMALYHVEMLFEKLDYDMTLKGMGCSHPAAFERWADFRKGLYEATLKNQIIKRKLDELETVPTVRAFFLPHRMR